MEVGVLDLRLLVEEHCLILGVELGSVLLVWDGRRFLWVWLPRPFANFIVELLVLPGIRRKSR